MSRLRRRSAAGRARGTLLAKSALVVAGLDVAMSVPAARSRGDRRGALGDGAHVQPHDVIAMVTGTRAALLTGERTALNVLQRLCGIATLTDKFVTAAAGRITVLDTRKTTPGWRDLEKYAVRCGGGTNHRERLDDGVLIKDNHKRLGGGCRGVQAAQEAGPALPSKWKSSRSRSSTKRCRPARRASCSTTSRPTTSARRWSGLA